MNIPKKSLLELDVAPASAATTTAIVSKETEKTWVTCFGFPPGQCDVVVQYFQTVKRLPVVDFEPKNDRNANWVHIKLRSQKDAAVALGESGQILDINGNKIMIGVNIFLEGDQLDAKAKGQAAQRAPLVASTVTSGGGPRRASTLWEKAAVWVMDM